jgi:hypothetical protein
MKKQELIDKVNNGNYHSIWEIELESHQLEAIENKLNPDEHRWYIVSTNIYKCEDGYVGVTGPSSLKSESMDWEDCYCDVVAEEYEEYTTVSYRPKTS